MLKCALFLLLVALLVLLFLTRWDRMKRGFKAFGILWLGLVGLYLISNWETMIAQGRFWMLGAVALGSLAFYGLAWLIFNTILAHRIATPQKRSKR